MPLNFSPNGDLFNSTCDVLVCTVNVVGAMGRGIALECKKRWPDAFGDYRRACEDGQLKIGTVKWTPLPPAPSQPKALLLFPTKLHYRNPSQLAYVTSGLRDFCERAGAYDYRTYAFPKLGCGYGGLDWTVVRQCMIRFLQQLPLQVTIFGEAPADFAANAAAPPGPARQLDLFGGAPSEPIDALPRDPEKLRTELRQRSRDQLVSLAIEYGLLLRKQARKEDAIASLVEYRLHRASRAGVRSPAEPVV